MKNMHQDLLGTGFYVTAASELMTDTGHRVFGKNKISARFYINKGEHKGKYLQCHQANYRNRAHIKLTIADFEGFEYYNIPAKIIKL